MAEILIWEIEYEEPTTEMETKFKLVGDKLELAHDMARQKATYLARQRGVSIMTDVKQKMKTVSKSVDAGDDRFKITVTPDVPMILLEVLVQSQQDDIRSMEVFVPSDGTYKYDAHSPTMPLFSPEWVDEEFEIKFWYNDDLAEDDEVTITLVGLEAHGL